MLSWQPGQRFNQCLNSRNDGKGRTAGRGRRLGWESEMTTGEDEKIEMQGDMSTACSLHFPPRVQSKQAGQTTVSGSERRRGRGADRQSFYPLMCLMVPFDSEVYYRVLSLKPGECPHQLDMMTKTLWVRDDKFPWLRALKFILHSYRWISPIFQSLFNGADKWSIAVIQSISCLSRRSLDFYTFRWGLFPLTPCFVLSYALRRS